MPHLEAVRRIPTVVQLHQIERNDAVAARQWVREQLEAGGLDPEAAEVLYMSFDDFEVVERIIDEEQARLAGTGQAP